MMLQRTACMQGRHGASSTRNGTGVKTCQPLMRTHITCFLQPKRDAGRAAALYPRLSHTCILVAAQMVAHMPYLTHLWMQGQQPQPRVKEHAR